MTDFGKISEKAQTFGNWCDVYRNAPRGSERRETALRNMAALAQTYDDWYDVYCFAHNNHEFARIALDNMVEFVVQGYDA